MTEIIKSKPSAKIICDSISPSGVRLTTMELKIHRFVLAELNTHGALARNSASSRAIPIEKKIKQVLEDPAMPLFYGSAKPGMQAGAELDEVDKRQCKIAIIYQRDYAMGLADQLNGYKLHKQIVNRYLEPWFWHTVIMTGIEDGWSNVFAQRSHPDAQPEIKAVSDAAQLEYYTNKPTYLHHGEWHLPYCYDEDWIEIQRYTGANDIEVMKKVSVARCARVSSLNHDNKRDLAKDIEFYDNTLHAKGHWSPFEHVNTPCDCSDERDHKGCPMAGRFVKGWHQFRKFFPNENRTKFIPNLPELKDIAAELRAKYGVER